MKKILINFLGIGDSGTVFTFEMAKGLYQNGYEIYAIISKYAENLKDWERASFINKLVIVDTHSSKVDYIKHIFKYTKIVEKFVYEQLGDIEFDCTIRTFPHPMLGTVEKKLIIKQNITICHDPISHSGTSLIAVIRDNIIMRKADKLIVLTEKFRKTVAKKYKKNIKDVIYMPHGLMGAYKEKQKNSNMIVYDESKFNFLFFGRIQDYKGLEILGDAFAKLERKFDNVTLTVAGKGDFNKFSSHYSMLHHFTLINRYIKEEEVGNLFDSNSVIAVIPYVDATQSGVIPIAIEYENPIISSNAGGLVEQLNDGKIGLFFENGNCDDLYKKMSEVIDNRDIILGMKRDMKNYSRQLSWDVVTKVFKEIV